MLKKTLTLIALVIALSLSAQAAAATPPAYTLEGIVLEVSDGGSLLMESEQWGKVLVNTNAKTVWEGLQKPEAGAWVTALFSGVMTKSSPPQVTAGLVSSHRLEGTVLDADLSDGIALVDALTLGPVLVRLPRMDTLPAAGDFIRVYHRGIMALSSPGQVIGMQVTKLALEEGVISETGGGWFLMEGAGGAVRVNTDHLTAMPEPIETGDTARVYYSGIKTRSIPAQVFGLVVLRAPID